MASSVLWNPFYVTTVNQDHLDTNSVFLDIKNVFFLSQSKDWDDKRKVNNQKTDNKVFWSHTTDRWLDVKWITKTQTTIFHSTDYITVQTMKWEINLTEMQCRQIKFPRVTVQTDNKMKNKPNRDAAQINKVFWSHSTDRQ